MPFNVADRVKETSTTTGTSPITLNGAVARFQTFASAISVNGTTPYVIVHDTLTEWETGIGTLTDSTTLARTQVLASSNAGALVNFSAGTKNVFVGNIADVPIVLRNVQPQSPATDRMALFNRAIAGRSMLATVGPSGLSTALQPLIGRRKFGQIVPSANIATLQTLGLQLSAVGTATVAACSSTNLHQSMVRQEYLQTASLNTNVVNVRSTQAVSHRGTIANQGGFFVVFRFGAATGTSNTSRRVWCGVSFTPFVTDLDLLAQTNLIGICALSTDTNYRLIHNDGSGTPTTQDLGASFPKATADRTEVSEVALFAPPNGTFVDWQFTNLVSGASTSGTITSDLPAGATNLSPQITMSVGGVSAVVGLATFGMYVETNLA